MVAPQSVPMLVQNVGRTKRLQSQFSKMVGLDRAAAPLQRIVMLKSELQAKLNRAAATGANDGVGRCHIRCRARATERSTRRVVVGPSILPAERVGEVRMVEDVEEFCTELGPEEFAPFEVLGH